MHHAFKLGDTEHNVEISRSADAYRLHLGDQEVAVDLKTGADGRAWLTLGERHVEVVIATRGDDVFVHLDGEAYQLRYQHPLDRLAAQAGGAAEDNIRAPMPGSIVAVQVKAGDAVTKGQTLLVMESMKMETTIAAPRDGTIAAITYEKGQTFDRDALLLSLEPNK
ncbi:biotin/lipoyl-binding protein [Solimonas sp. K1W22B-7]|uniref:acetyl-CoA carboxylase biotin carboxyl carrier protein subunit n=1 Tax=Solimonas sp. K1W22B-7 TaxID=2303331 RepID=UPI000E3361DE|nr:biotin/lipoyl-containing protein [Solimonas sp. K1W22B-7]AXQ28693.1 biotin/lipoyl-binding protein [Solimonas sp. K1W22B-7]